MRRILRVAVIVGLGMCTIATRAHAQDAARLWIRSVTVDAGASILTITGTGFSDTCEVTLDGEALTVLPGASATQLVVVASASVLATPGTYRLTVVDPARKAGDAFEMTVSPRAGGSPGSPGESDPVTREKEAAPLDPGVRAPRFGGGPVDSAGTRLLESPGDPFNAGFGYEVLQNNSSSGVVFGRWNTAGGYQALYNNTLGSKNTGIGYRALYGVGTGANNTALGNEAGADAYLSHHTIYIGSGVRGIADEDNTMRLGLPFTDWPNYDGINRTFIAGVRQGRVNGAAPVGVDAYGQLGLADKLGAGLGYGCDTCYQNGTIELYNPGTGDMTLQSGPSYRLLFNPGGGNVGLGVYSRLGAGFGFGCDTCYQNGFLQLYNPGTGNLTMQSGTSFDMLLNPFGGNVGIGTSDAQYPLHLGNGAHVTAGGVWTNASSRALKDHITPLTLDEAQEALVALAPVKYTYKADPSEMQVGFIAEDVPTLVAQNDRASLSPMDLVAVLTKVVQGQQALLAAQQTELEALQVRLAMLEAAVRVP